MTDSDPPPMKRLKLSRKDLEELSKEDLVEKWMEQEQYVDVLETRNSEGQKDSLELVSLRESEDKLRQQQLEATRRENLLVMRLAAKEQEMQECAHQIQELKQAQTPGSAQLRSTLLDPAVNLMFERMKKELLATKAKLEETQNELSAWKFTPDRWRQLLNFAHSPLLSCNEYARGASHTSERGRPAMKKRPAAPAQPKTLYCTHDGRACIRGSPPTTPSFATQTLFLSSRKRLGLPTSRISKWWNCPVTYCCLLAA